MISIVSGFLLLRFFHGFSTGFMPTGTVAYLADIIPDNRRGEGMGLVGIMNNIGFMVGNSTSSLVTRSLGIDGMFLLSGFLAFLSVAIVFRMKETLPNKQKFQLKHLKVKPEDVLDKRATEPAMVIMLTACTFGALLTLVPDFSVGLGIKDKGLFMLYLTIATITTRLLTSKLSDKIGRAKSCLIGTGFWILGALSLSTLNYHMFFVGAVLCGFASGINSPAIFAWAVDVAKGEKAGRSIATLFIALEIGIGGGAWLSAAIYGNVFENLKGAFMVLAAINALALAYVFYKVRIKPKLASRNLE
jgi:MFS family permease